MANIELDTETYTARVALDIQEKYHQIPDTSSLAIRTAGLLGKQYLALNVSFQDPDMGTAILKDGDTIQDTKSAIVLEDLVGQCLYKSDIAKPGDLAAGTVASQPTVPGH